MCVAHIVVVVAQIRHEQRQIRDADDLPVFDAHVVEGVQRDRHLLRLLLHTLGGDDDLLDDEVVCGKRLIDMRHHGKCGNQ